MPERNSKSRHGGFTLIELLVVMIIIGILMTLVLTAIRSAYRTSLKTSEMNQIRQVGNGLLMYCTANQDKLVPGWASIGVQEAWDRTIVYPDFAEIPPAPIFESWCENTAGPWTWHLTQYIDDPFVIMRGHLPKNEQHIENFIEQGHEFAMEPSFAYNGWYLGGQWDFWDPHFTRPQLRFDEVEHLDGSKGYPVLRNLPSTQRPTEVVAFCSSFRADGPMSEPPRTAEMKGSWLVEPRLLANTMKWGLDDGGDLYIHEETHAPLGRHRGPPVAWFLDGHTSTQTHEELADQRRWIDGAKDVGDRPARDYTHEDDVH